MKIKNKTILVEVDLRGNSQNSILEKYTELSFDRAIGSMIPENLEYPS